MGIYILALYGSILFFILALKWFSLEPFKIFKLNFILIPFTFILMIASIFQEKLKIKINTETLILILFNFLVINYENIIEAIRKIKKIKLGGIEVELGDYEVIEKVKVEMNKYNAKDDKTFSKDNIDIDSKSNDNINNGMTLDEKKMKFLYNYFLIESFLRKIYLYFFASELPDKKLSLDEMYLKIIRERRSINTKAIFELEKAYPVFKTMRILRNKLAHNIQNENLNDIDYKNLVEIQEKIWSNLKEIINQYNIKG